MPTFYRVNLFHEAINETVNQVLTHFSKRLSMSRHPAPPELTATQPDVAAPHNVAFEDWDAMFTAVKARLMLVARAPDGITPAPTVGDSAQVARLYVTVLECVAALDQLHSTARDGLMGLDRR